MSDSEGEASPVKIAKKQTMAEDGLIDKKTIIRTKSMNPSTADMVNTAIKSLNDRRGSSVRAIKKYITANYTVEMNRLSPMIKRHLKRGVEDGSIIQKSGIGATGSFKLAPTKKVSKKMPKVTEETAEDSKKPAVKPRIAIGPKSKKPTMQKSKPTKQKSQDKEPEGKVSDNEEDDEEVVPKKPKSPPPKDKASKKPAKKKMAEKETTTQKKKNTSRKRAGKEVDDDSSEKLVPKSPSMAKKAARSPVAKPRAPKPKKLTAKNSKK